MSDDRHRTATEIAPGTDYFDEVEKNTIEFLTPLTPRERRKPPKNQHRVRVPGDFSTWTNPMADGVGDSADNEEGQSDDR
ncbi:MAG: hypothetical protein WCK89_17855 [bacterium]